MRSLALQYIKPVYIPVLPLGKSKVQYTMTTFHAIQSNIKPRATQLLFSSLFTWLGFKENSKYTFKKNITKVETDGQTKIERRIEVKYKSACIYR